MKCTATGAHPQDNSTGQTVRRRRVALTLLLAISLPPAAAGPPTKEPPPAWVETLPLDLGLPVDQDITVGRVHYHLVESQTNQLTRQQYRRVVYQVLDSEGVRENSSVSLLYSPGETRLALHRLQVIRDGVISDRLPTQPIRLLEREQSLEQNLYDGRVSAHLLLEDIRAGDIIDYAWSMTGYPDIMDGRFFLATPLQYSAPLGRYLIRHLAAPDMPFHFRMPDGVEPPRIKAGDGQVEYRWELADVPALASEPGTPAWHAEPPLVMKGEFERWQELADWARPMYRLDQPLPPDIAEHLSSWADLPPDRKITEALRYVQREVRYVAVSIGPHSYRPYPVDDVWQRRFGDCKDKALLLTLILRQLGFMDAWPALVNTQAGTRLPEMQPAPGAFDHALVYLAFRGHDYWLDPTAPEQFGPLEQIYTQNHAWALVLRPGEDQLLAMRNQAYDHARQEIVERVELAGYTSPARLTVNSRYFGWEADSIRRMFARTPLGDISDHYLAYYQEVYPEARIRSLPAINDDLEDNIFEVSEEYELPGFFMAPRRPGERYTAVLRASAIDPYVRPPERRDRRTPQGLRHPTNIQQSISITLPPGSTSFEREQARVDHPAISYQREVRPDGDTLHINHQFRTLQDHVPAGEFPGYVAETSQVYDLTDYVIDAPGSFFGTDSPSDGLSLQAALAVLISSLLAGCVLAIAALLARPGPRWIAWNQRRRARSDDNTAGLGGLLILLGLSAVVTAGAAVVLMGVAINLMSPETLHDLTDPAGGAYGAQWRYQLLSIFALAGMLLPLSFAQLYLFFRKRWIFPWFAIGFYLAASLLSLIAPLGMTRLPPGSISPTELAGEWMSWAASALVALLWTFYLLVSARVANTFVRHPLAATDPVSGTAPAPAAGAMGPGSS